jgi:hypothetical protein
MAEDDPATDALKGVRLNLDAVLPAVKDVDRGFLQILMVGGVRWVGGGRSHTLLHPLFG